ncbi:hypothetical protein [Saccharopolyspora dendranthemae]|uniref:Uncharacterized protein n=1 Tax=Saccharopolyspora dendranthemae TaxID=1181886 RepID=A0A561U146_9PSEU|nr:hypothetical protein [Saccharopolyspora dendranthemae]TWF93071.1 hypothetical protein FHU35_16354 [Saccharopolyspora dendranthemae]
MLQIFWPLVGLLIGGGLGFLVGFLVFRPKQAGHGYAQQPQFAQPQQWQAAPQQPWQQTPPQQFPPQHGYGQQPRPPQ